MSDTALGIAFGLQVGAAAFHFYFAGRYFRRRKELERGHRQGNTDTGSPTGAALDSQLTAISAAALSYATRAKAGEAGASPRVTVPQEIIAERCWHLLQDEFGPVLFSYSQCVPWRGPTLPADAIPDTYNTNGIYAQKILDHGYRQLPVVGTVALSGVVVEGENGYRAERATIRSLTLRFLPSETPAYAYGSTTWPLTWKKRAWEIAEQLANRYCCDVGIDWIPSSALPAEEVVT